MNVLFVCSGNASRSVLAEAMLKKAVADRKLSGVEVRSCGTAVEAHYRVPPVVGNLLAVRGIDDGGHRPTQVTRRMLENADLVLVMEERHRRYLLAFVPEAEGKVFLLKEYIGARGEREIPDPRGGPDAAYASTAEKIEKYIGRLAEMIAASIN